MKLAGGGSLRVADGINDAWLAELLSPAFSDWLARSPEGFDWELADGVLCASVRGHLSGESELTRLCADAAHIAGVVREECLEEVDSGRRRAAPRGQAQGRRRSSTRSSRGPPSTIRPPTSRRRGPSSADIVARHPATYLIALFMTLAFMLAANVIGGGIFGLLLNLPNPGQAVLIFRLFLFVVIGFFVLRSRINGTSQKLAVEGFWREYARTRGLRAEDPSSFAAAHAKADLPGAPARVMTGMLGGVDGSLMVTGDGLGAATRSPSSPGRPARSPRPTSSSRPRARRRRRSTPTSSGWPPSCATARAGAQGPSAVRTATAWICDCP